MIKDKPGSYCTYCGKKIKDRLWHSRHGHKIRIFFKLIPLYIVWDQYFCTQECDDEFWRGYEK